MRARPLAKAGYGDCPCGVEVWLPSGAVLYLQAVTTAPSPTARPTAAGEWLAVEEVVLPQEGPTELALVERWLAWRIAGAGADRVEGVELFQAGPRRPTSVPYGLALWLRGGGRAWVYVRHPTPKGREPGAGALWWRQAAV